MGCGHNFEDLKLHHEIITNKMSIRHKKFDVKACSFMESILTPYGKK